MRRKDYWEIKFDGTDKPKYLSVLRNALANSTDAIRQDFVESFNNKVELNKRKADEAVADLEQQIENATQDYDKAIQRRLAFLGEQAAIARRLGVKKDLSLLEQNASVLTVIEGSSENPFYLRGYDAIEEEINQLNNRGDKSLFVSGLLDLEKKKREILQNPLLDRVKVPEL